MLQQQLAQVQAPLQLLAQGQERQQQGQLCCSLLLLLALAPPLYLLLPLLEQHQQQQALAQVPPQVPPLVLVQGRQGLLQLAEWQVQRWLLALPSPALQVQVQRPQAPLLPLHGCLLRHGVIWGLSEALLLVGTHQPHAHAPAWHARCRARAGNTSEGGW